MAESRSVITRVVDQLRVVICTDRREMGSAAGEAAAQKLRDVLAAEGKANMVFAAAPSQNEFLDALVAAGGIDWSRVTAFHLDEYIGLPADAPQRFAQYLHDHLFSRVEMGRVHLIDPGAEPAAECQRYSALLAAHPLHIACVGIGENGHLAFNDPPVADFADPVAAKVVELEQRCRQQQVNDGCFPSLTEVPTHAITMTIPAIMAAQSILCMVPGVTKQEAVKRTLSGSISTECPATVLRRHPAACLYLDRDAAQLIL